MADFVNYNKRDFNLPPGCKDLIDLLKPREDTPDEAFKAAVASIAKRHKMRRETEIRPVSEISRYLKILAASHAVMCNLSIETPDKQITANVRRISHDKIRASINVQEDSEQERSILDFLSSHGLKLPKAASLHRPFLPDLPVFSLCEIAPLPADPEKIANLLVDLFRHIGLTDETCVTYDYSEISERV